VAYTDADTIKAVAEEKLEGVLSELKPKWVGTQNSMLMDGQTENAAPSEGTKDWLKNPLNTGKLQIVLRGSGANLIQTDSDIDLSNKKKFPKITLLQEKLTHVSGIWGRQGS
jgi:hypothetical protein